MAKQLVILVHGMGTHAKGEMIKDFKKAVAERAKDFGISESSFLEGVDYQEFNYSDYFDAIRKQFADNAAARAKGFGYLEGMGFEEKLIKQLTSFEAKFGKDKFFYTHWLDVILYSTTYFGEKVRLDFIILMEKLRKKYDHKNMHIISHSLGTAVVHDALAKYYRANSTPFDEIPDLKTGNFNLSSLWTFANVSRMVNQLNGLTDPLDSTVVTGADGCTNNFFNISNYYDPFTWFLSYSRKMEYLTALETKVIRKANTHDFPEYVGEPRVVRELLALVYGQQVDDVKFDAVFKTYQESDLVEQFKKLRDSIEDARNDPSIRTLKEAIARFKGIIDIIVKDSKEG